MLKRDQLEFNKEARQEAISKAFEEYKKFEDKILNHKYMVVVNMREPSYRKRLYVVDMEGKEVIRNHHVSHGINSSNVKDFAYANSFSNKINSHRSSLGAMRTGDTYVGKHGKSLKLHGLEKGVNDNVAARYIVVHGANYVTDDYIMRNERAGRSHGCPAVDPAIAQELISLIKGGVFFYVYY